MSWILNVMLCDKRCTTKAEMDMQVVRVFVHFMNSSLKPKSHVLR